MALRVLIGQQVRNEAANWSTQSWLNACMTNKIKTVSISTGKLLSLLQIVGRNVWLQLIIQVKAPVSASFFGH